MKHYDVHEIAPLHYMFDTNGGGRYELAFVYSSELGEIPVYAFNIERIAKGKETAEDKDLVRDTVAYVLQLFFDDVDNAILSTCDVDDGMQMGRKRLFDSWYKKLAPPEIMMIDAQVDSGMGMTWATMYYHRDNMFRSLIENAFREYEEVMNALGHE